MKSSSKPAEPFELNVLEFLLCLRTARLGAAAGPSSVSRSSDPHSGVRGPQAGVCQERFCKGFGQITALKNPMVRHLETSGGADDCQTSFKVEKATVPLQSLTDQHSNATVVSCDGIGACDLISRNSTLEGRGRRSGPHMCPVFLGEPIDIFVGR